MATDSVPGVVEIGVAGLAAFAAFAAAAIAARSALVVERVRVEVARDSSKSSARSARDARLLEARLERYPALWSATWPLSRHLTGRFDNQLNEPSEVGRALTEWYGQFGYLLTRDSTRAWMMLVDACNPERRPQEIDTIAAAVFIQERTRPRSADFEWELPVSLESWRESGDDSARRDLLLALLSSDLRSSLASDVLARGSQRDEDLGS